MMPLACALLIVAIVVIEAFIHAHREDRT